MNEWKKNALDKLKSYYLSFGGTQFDEYNINEVDQYLLAKICYAMYGLPTKSNEIVSNDISNGYPEEQREKAKEILDIILKVCLCMHLICE